MMPKAGHAVQHNGHRLGGIIEETKERFSGLTDEAMRIESQMVDDAKKKGGELLEGAQEKGQQAWERTAKWIKKSPGSAVGAAFVIGVVLSAWFSRSKE
jgi:ElaB/YqjD/DUF883 family membrane-anchored ribosome-binding protein